MKTILLKLIFLLVATLGISCSNSDDNNNQTPPTGTNNNFIKATINGVAYEVTGDQITALQDAVSFSMRSDITGGGTGMDFSVLGTSNIGSYPFNSGSILTQGRLNYRLNSDIFTSSTCALTGGLLTITSKNGNTIEGTFSFNGKKIGFCSDSPKVITNGTFRVTFL